MIAENNLNSCYTEDISPIVQAKARAQNQQTKLVLKSIRTYHLL
jgi:hypothetical protein